MSLFKEKHELALSEIHQAMPVCKRQTDRLLKDFLRFGFVEKTGTKFKQVYKLIADPDKPVKMEAYTRIEDLLSLQESGKISKGLLKVIILQRPSAGAS